MEWSKKNLLEFGYNPVGTFFAKKVLLDGKIYSIDVHCYSNSYEVEVILENEDGVFTIGMAHFQDKLSIEEAENMIIKWVEETSKIIY